MEWKFSFFPLVIKEMDFDDAYIRDQENIRKAISRIIRSLQPNVHTGLRKTKPSVHSIDVASTTKWLELAGITEEDK